MTVDFVAQSMEQETQRQEIEARGERGRDLTLDWVKGVLVIVMVIYHAMNIFTSAPPSDYAYIRFVSGSFVLLSGFTIARFNADSWRSAKAWPLILRGLKLVALFTVLNLIISITGAGNPTKPHHELRGFASAIYDIFVVGAQRQASFQILLPIAYLLIVAPLFLALRAYRGLVALVVAIFVLAYALSPMESVNLEFLLFGLAGLSGGLVLRGWEAPWLGRNLGESLASLVVVILAMKFLSVYFISLLVGMVLLLKIFYDVGKRVDRAPWLSPSLVLFGRLSLVCYIAQIVFLQLLSKAMGRPRWDLGYEVLVPILVTTAFLLGLSMLIRHLDARSRLFAHAYAFVFR